MPKRGALALGLTAVALALLLSFQTPTDVPALAARAGSGAGTGTVSDGSTGSGTSGSTTADAGTRRVTGPTVDTRWGPVQVSVQLQGTELLDVTALQLPSGGRSGQISGYAEPILRSQALRAQGSDIDGVSGATFTSVAYARSLQAALDSAGA